MVCQFTIKFHIWGEAIQRGILQVWIILAPPWDAARPLPGQVLAHWIAICRWHHGGPQSGYPVLSNSLQIVSISEVVTMILAAVACIDTKWIEPSTAFLGFRKWKVRRSRWSSKCPCCIGWAHLTKSNNEALLCGQHAFTGRHAGFEGGPFARKRYNFAAKQCPRLGGPMLPHQTSHQLRRWIGSHTRMIQNSWILLGVNNV